MTKSTHICAGIAAGVICNVSAPLLILVGIGSLLPDIDIQNSTLGSKVKFLSSVLEHRGFTHSLLFLAITFFLNPYIGLGVFTHIFLDLLNPAGVKLFYPLKVKPKIAFLRTGGTGEKIIFWFLCIIIFLFVLYNLMMSSYETNVYVDFFKIFSNAKENILDFISFVKNLISSIN